MNARRHPNRHWRLWRGSRRWACFSIPTAHPHALSLGDRALFVGVWLFGCLAASVPAGLLLDCVATWLGA